MFCSRLQSLALCALTSVVLAASLPAVGQRQYTVTDLGIAPGKVSTSVYGNHSVNYSGMVVGHCNLGGLTIGFFGDYFSENVAFSWTKTNGMQILPMPVGSSNASCFSLNDHGQIIGFAGNSYLDGHVVLWDKGAVFDLPILPGDNGSYPQAINNHGQIVGVSSLNLTADGFNLASARPVIWEKGQISLLPLGGFFGGQANDINEKGQIAGYLNTVSPGGPGHYLAVLWDKGAITTLGSIGGGSVQPWDINDKAQIVGSASAPDGSIHAFIWDNGVFTDLGTRGGTWAALWAMNNRGQAVGESTDAAEDDHAIIVENGVMTDLNDWIPADSGWVLIFADGINERGQISGTGIHNGEVRGFLLTPKK